MVVVPAGERTLPVRFRRRETGLYDVAPYVDEWKPLPPRLHDLAETTRTVTLGPVAVAPREVSNREFAEFLAATRYRPRIANRFLAHWSGGRPRSGTEDEPVTYVDLADARAYADWRGMRLPTEDEWQAADPGRRDAAGVELDRERARRRPEPVRDPQGRDRGSLPRAPTGTPTAGRRIRR